VSRQRAGPGGLFCRAASSANGGSPTFGIAADAFISVKPSTGTHSNPHAHPRSLWSPCCATAPRTRRSCRRRWRRRRGLQGAQARRPPTPHACSRLWRWAFPRRRRRRRYAGWVGLRVCVNSV
jgi:hypothetical protein